MFKVMYYYYHKNILFYRGINGTPLQYSCVENPMDGRAWLAAVHGVAKSWTRLSDFTFTFHFHALEKEMATHSSVLAWRIPGTGEAAIYGVAQSRTRMKRLSSSSSSRNILHLVLKSTISILYFLILFYFCSVAKSCLTLWPHGLQHNRLSYPSPTSGICSNSCPLSPWCYHLFL